MRKVFWILLGLVVFAAAAGFATNRHVLEPQRSRSVSMSSSPRPAAPSSQASRPSSPSSSSSTSSTAAWATFDTVVNVLNVVVGVLGIWMTFHGMRMQRMALNAQSQNRR